MEHCAKFPPMLLVQPIVRHLIYIYIYMISLPYHIACMHDFFISLFMMHCTISVTRRENSPMSQKHMQANDANYCEDIEERYDDTRENQGN